jgi:outer membrane protein assembly factor BamD
VIRRPRAAAALAAAAGLAALLACASAPTNEVLPAAEEYERGREAFGRGDFHDAITYLNRLVLNYPEDGHVVEARYLLGLANYEVEEYPTAAQDFERFQTDYPADSLADDALYWAGRSYEAQSLEPPLDQSDTRRAISSYTDLVRQYPGSEHASDADARVAALRERLAEKEYMNTRFYARQELWEATEIYARSLIEEYPQSKWVAPAYLLLLRAFEAQGKTAEAAAARETLLEQFPESPEATEVRQAAGPPDVSLQADAPR